MPTPEWDGTLSSQPKNTKKNVSWKGCHAVLDNSPQEEQLFLKAFNDTI
jgi:hypothetical protein